MATNAVKLTKRTVNALAPRNRPFIAFDADLKGFGLRIMPTGSKTFILEYRPGAGAWKWEYVDFERAIIFLPDSKTGKKPLFLNAAAIDILSEIPRLSGNPYIFPGQKEGSPIFKLSKPWQA